jgi:hypothetical protein
LKTSFSGGFSAGGFSAGGFFDAGFLPSAFFGSSFLAESSFLGRLRYDLSEQRALLGLRL